MFFRKTVSNVVASLRKMVRDLDKIATYAAADVEYHSAKKYAAETEQKQAAKISHNINSLLGNNDAQ